MRPTTLFCEKQLIEAALLSVDQLFRIEEVRNRTHLHNNAALVRAARNNHQKTVILLDEEGVR